jgi:hypothetical protein
VLRRAGLVIIVCLLGACATPPKTITTPEPVRAADDVAGIWNDYLWLAKFCGNELGLGVRLELEQSGLAVTGQAELLGTENEIVPGTFTGSVTEDGVLSGVVTYQDAYYYAAFDIEVMHEAETMRGTMMSREQQRCIDDSVSFVTGVLELVTEAKTTLSADALEPNNSRTQAAPLTNGELKKDLTITPGDVDWFSFEISEASRLVTFAELRSDFYVRLQLFDSGTSLLSSKDIAPSSELSAQVNIAALAVALQPGKYYLAVSGGDDETFEGKHTGNGKYELTLETSVVPLDEFESNDSREDATPVTLNFSETLSLFKGDEDWFTFTLDKAANVSVDVSGAKYDFIYELYDSSSLLFQRYQSFESVQTRLLGPGTYYVRVYNSFGNLDYPLVISSQPINDNTYEPNDSSDTASNITLPFKQDLYLTSGDKDWFKFSLDQTSTLSVKTNNLEGFKLYDTALTQLRCYAPSCVWPAGTYSLLLEGYGSAPYSLEVTADGLPDQTKEPNDNEAQATPLTVNHSLPGLLYGNDEDWFVFTLTSGQVVGLDLSQATYGIRYELFQAGSSRGDVLTYEGPIVRGLNAGTYYLRLTYSYPSSPTTGAAYALYTLNFTSQDLPDKTYEPNNSFNTASRVTLPFQQDLYFTAGDEDWFRFTVTQEQVLSFRAAMMNGIVSVYLYNNQGQQLKEGYFETSSLAIAYLVPAGTYYLKFVSSYFAAPAYTVSVSAESVPDVTLEPNNILSAATKIQLGFEKDMLVNGNNDDWFSFTLPETTQVRFAFSQANQGYVTAYLTKVGDSNQQSIYNLYEPILSAGTYYIQITSYDTVNYRLGVVKK